METAPPSEILVTLYHGVTSHRTKMLKEEKIEEPRRNIPY
jgi:hypothetical protein